MAAPTAAKDRRRRRRGSNTTALFRQDNGSIDTDNNAQRLRHAGAPNPRRTAPIVELGPLVLSTDPRANGINAPRDATIQVTFTEPVDVDRRVVRHHVRQQRSAQQRDVRRSFGGQDHYITPNDNFIAGEQCTVTIFKDRIHDEDLDDSGPNTDTLPANYVWSFTVATGTAPPYPAERASDDGQPQRPPASDPAEQLPDGEAGVRAVRTTGTSAVRTG